MHGRNNVQFEVQFHGRRLCTPALDSVSSHKLQLFQLLIKLQQVEVGNQQ